METIPQEIIMYTVAALVVVVIVLVIFLIRTEIRLKRLSRGQGKFNLEDTIKSIENDLEDLGVFRSDMKDYLTSVEKRLKRSVQGVSNVSFSAFQGLDSGGNQSFATAFLNEEGNGIILSTLHARDRVNVFAKEIKAFNCELTLTDEEKSALTQAKKSCKL